MIASLVGGGGLITEETDNLLQDDLSAVTLGSSLAFPSAFKSALHDGLAEAVMPYDVVKPCHL